jgi:hypothetical protein
MKNNIKDVKISKLLIFIFLKVLPILVPIIVFFTFNMLTPVWWDDFIMSCFFTEWHVPRHSLLSSFSDVIISTYNMYQTWHGRSVADFLNFLFMFLKNKNIFNVCNTIVYFIFILLTGFHITGSLKKITALFFLFINILFWLLLSAWGQTLLWLTGSFNYLWTTTIILLFMIPFRKKIENISYRPYIIISFLWLIPGILAGWSVENSASGVFILLLAYFFWKKCKKEPVLTFEISGSIGFMIGFFMLIRARDIPFPGFWDLVKNTAKVVSSFIINDALLLGIIILLAIELTYFKKEHIAKVTYGYFFAALGSVATMILPGFYGGRSAFFTQVFLVITLLSLVIQMKQFIPGRYFIMMKIAIVLVFIPSFYTGSVDIGISFFYSEARERYILSEKQKGNLKIRVKTPIPVYDSHNGMFNGIDVLFVSTDREYITHNSAKTTWYGIESLDGIPTYKRNGLQASIKKFVNRRKPEGLNIDDMFAIIYEDW